MMGDRYHSTNLQSLADAAFFAHMSPGGNCQASKRKPLEHDGHDEADSNNTDNENKREVKDHRRRNASNGVGINEADGGEILETVPKPLLLRAIVVHGQIFPVIGAVRCLHIVENTWVGQNNEYSRFKDGKAELRVLHIVPSVIDLPEDLNLVEHLTRFC
jgi:hypothetical protein